MRKAIVLPGLGLVAATITGAATPEAYAAPAPVPSVVQLDARYDAVQRNIQKALDRAAELKDGERGKAFSAMRRPGRNFLSFDARGRGRAVEVFGDLVEAQRIIVVVPGADNTLGNFDSPKFVGGSARNLYDQARKDSPGVAVVAWLGYNSPSTLSTDALHSGRAKDGARSLTAFTGELRQVSTAPLSLACHSYGSIICAKAAKDVGATDIAVVGSPGTDADTASDLGGSARFWAGKSTGDWMRWVPNVGFLGLGFGQDPTAPAFGARTFPAGDGAHSAYFKAGSLSLRNLALIGLGRGSEVGHA